MLICPYAGRLCLTPQNIPFARFGTNNLLVRDCRNNESCDAGVLSTHGVMRRRRCRCCVCSFHLTAQQFSIFIDHEHYADAAANASCSCVTIARTMLDFMPPYIRMCQHSAATSVRHARQRQVPRASSHVTYGIFVGTDGNRKLLQGSGGGRKLLQCSAAAAAAASSGKTLEHA